MTPSFIEQARRRQIIEAAIAVMAEDGYAKTSLSRIAQKAGISKSIISYHFAGKDQLFEQMFVHVVEAAGRHIAPHIEGASTAAERVAAYIRHQIAYMREHRAELLAIGHLSLNHGGPEGPDYIVRAEADEVELLEGLFAEGQRSGEFRAFERRVMAMALAKAIEGVLTEWAWRPETDLDAWAEELVALFGRAMKADP